MKTETVLLLVVLGVGGFVLYRQFATPNHYGQGGVGGGSRGSDSDTGGVGAGSGRTPGSGSTFDRGMGAVDKGQKILTEGKGLFEELGVNW